MVLAASFHLSAIFIFPSLFYLAFATVPRGSRQKIRNSPITNAAILACVTAFMMLGYYFVHVGSLEGSTAHLLVYPLGGGEESYPFYSPAHLLDFLNHQLLASPVNVVLWMMLILFLRKVVNFKEPVVRFLAVLCLCSLAFALVIYPGLGYARDWDLFAFTGLATTLLALYLAVDGFRTLRRKGECGQKRELGLGRLTAILLVTSLVSTLPWILVNASKPKSMARWNALRRLERYDEAIDAYRRSLQIGPNHPTIQLLHESLGICLAEVGRYDGAIDELNKAISLRPGRADYYYTLSDILGRSGKYEEALSCFERALNLEPINTRAYRTLGVAYLEIGKKEAATRCLETYLKSGPADADQIQGIIDSVGLDAQAAKPEGIKEH
jgi:tetratricopeptide (TPR) repeat protein